MNVSEGRDAERLRRIAGAAGSVRGAFLLSVPADTDHHRAVLTLAGEPEAVLEAALKAAAEAVTLIDLNHHQGVHPRIGAVDVVPFVPLKGVSMAHCVELAKRFGETFAARQQVPVYLYEEAAQAPARRNLANLRLGGFEGLRHAIETDPDRHPDYGPPRLHPTAGATAVGAREILVAFNVFLGTRNVRVAQTIASEVRESSGGLRGVKALGLYLEHRRRVQVSMNLTRLGESTPWQVLEAVKARAERLETRVTSSEIIGHLPRAALGGLDLQDLLVENAWPGMILEDRFAELTGSHL